MTGSSIANNTLNSILEHSKAAREVGVVSASANLIPDPLFARGVKIVGTIRALNPDRLMEVVSEGGGTPHIKPAVKFTNITPKSTNGKRRLQAEE